MDKKSLMMLLLASSFASSAFATNSINQLIKHSSAIPSIVKSHNMTKQTNHPYTDFSGTWLAHCDDGQSFTTVIENNANYITLDGDESRIGPGLEGQSESNMDYTLSGHTSFEWNPDGSALIMKEVYVSKDNVDNSALQTDMSTFTLTMNKGRINLDGQFAMFKDLTPVKLPTNTMHCVFNKKQ